MSAVTLMSGVEMPLSESSLNSEQICDLVVVDLVYNEAVELAAKILPATPAAYDRSRFYLVKGTLPGERFMDPVSNKALVRIGDASAEFSSVGASEIETGELLRAVARLAAFCLGKRYGKGVIDGDEESLVCALDDLANALIVERIVYWLFEIPSSNPLCDV
jgi:hypothetical protein